MKLCYLPINEKSLIRQVVLSGDVHDDPRPVSFPCSVCKKPVATTYRAVECDSYHQWCYYWQKIRQCFFIKLQTYAQLKPRLPVDMPTMFKQSTSIKRATTTTGNRWAQKTWEPILTAKRKEKSLKSRTYQHRWTP